MNPTLIVEVVSDRTEAYDRGEKLAHYGRLSSLRQYVLVSHRAPRIEVLTRVTGEAWASMAAGAGRQYALAASLRNLAYQT